MLLKVFLAVLLCGSAVSFFLYGIDKWKAKRGTWRISEKTLLLLGFACGSVGALVAMQLFRHKTKHYYFYLINVLGLAWHAIAVCYLFSQGL